MELGYQEDNDSKKVDSVFNAAGQIRLVEDN